MDEPSIFYLLDLPRRHFLHGDISLESGKVYCRRCDLWHGIDHPHWLLADTEVNEREFRQSRAAMTEMRAHRPNWSKRFFRPRGAPNLYRGDL